MENDRILYRNANIITVDATRPRAGAMVVRAGRIEAVGDEHELARLVAPATPRVDLSGRTVVPGFCDSHIHLFWYGRQLLKQADLVGTADVEDLLARLSAVA